MRLFRRILKSALIATVILVLLIAGPIAYVEALCQDDTTTAQYKPIISEPEFQRKEANSYLTYPEWHIVYAYDGLAEVLKTSDEHAFGYLSSITGFWSSLCHLNRKAGRHGGADFATRSTAYVIGASFTLEMVFKALYEETLGRLFALVRGSAKSAQDRFAAEMATDYAKFLQQTPWYRYGFDTAAEQLWELPVTDPLRGWERRLALGGEWKAKSVYAGLIANAAAAAGGAQLEIRTVISGMNREAVETIDKIKVIAETPEHLVIETPRYRLFTNILRQLAINGGTVREIAGNDDIMVSILQPAGTGAKDLTHGTVISTVERRSFGDERILVDVKVDKLLALITSLDNTARALEHIYDY